jgi:hypothetical protein
VITHPRTEELVESVRLWIDEIRPSLDPRNAFLARVAANALATVHRELTQGPAAEAEAVARMAEVLGGAGDYAALNRRLCDGIRAGELTVETPGLLAALQVMARNQLGIDQPGYKPEGSLPPQSANRGD